MTRKDFQLIADTIAETATTKAQLLAFATAFADQLAKTNPRFDRQRFISACHSLTRRAYAN